MSDYRHFNSFEDFYPFYLEQHANSACRRLHFIGTTLVLLLLIVLLFSKNLHLLALLPFAGYSFAWVGHFVFEKNKPATFKYPIYSLMGDFRMYKDMISGKVPF